MPLGYINIPRCDIIVLENPMTFDYQMGIMTPEALDSIIEQCRDIKVKLMELGPTARAEAVYLRAKEGIV